jgi:hypothetical protein
MAGERKGIAYEAIVKIALEELVRKGKLTGTVFWNEKPDAMTIEPDFTVGTDKDHPTHVFLVTHSGAAGNSHMKFWRNIGELGEAKIRLKTPARVYSVAFDSVIKEDLKALQATAFDGQLLVGDSDYGRCLQWWVEANAPELPKDGDEKVDGIREAMKDSSRTDNPKSLIDGFVRDLGKLVQTTRPELDELWALERKRAHGSAPLARDTFVRRGMAKLLVLPAEVRKEVVAGKRTISDRPDLVPAVRLGIVAKNMSLRGKATTFRVADAETANALTLLSAPQLASVFSRPLPDGVQAVVEQVRSVTRLDAMMAGLVAHYDRLLRPAEMLATFEAQHADPSHLFLDATGAAPPEDVWLFRLVCESVKAVGGLKQGYGYAQMVQDIKRLASGAEMGRFVRTAAGVPKWELPASTEPVRRGLQDYVNRIPGTSFSRALLAVVAFTLSKRLAEIPKARLLAATNALAETWISSAFEARLLTHRSFDPVGWLVEDALRGCAHEEQYIAACFAEAAPTLSSTLSGTTKVIRAKHTLVNWQSASDEGREHKKKELCGRAVALRYSWDAENGKFVPRAGIERLILVVDGTWRQDDLDALALSGWDHIFYPHEADQLRAAVR